MNTTWASFMRKYVFDYELLTIVKSYKLCATKSNPVNFGIKEFRKKILAENRGVQLRENKKGFSFTPAIY